eukprot:1228620-Pleurochrysis_carterae.AAC.1
MCMILRRVKPLLPGLSKFVHRQRGYTSPEHGSFQSVKPALQAPGRDSMNTLITGPALKSPGQDSMDMLIIDYLRPALKSPKRT